MAMLKISYITIFFIYKIESCFEYFV